ncbi:hypothetical protein M405DRAFT_813386 [Rhizopogon salebrosus TDB-379]|nr:hypothetical protein M405DRAFT_813386 [Rhizopogon salebrosus TDB-379]
MVLSLSLKLLWPTHPSRLMVPFCIDVSGRKTLRVSARIAPCELSRKSVSVSY